MRAFRTHEAEVQWYRDTIERHRRNLRRAERTASSGGDLGRQMDLIAQDLREIIGMLEGRLANLLAPLLNPYTVVIDGPDGASIVRVQAVNTEHARARGEVGAMAAHHHDDPGQDREFRAVAVLEGHPEAAS